MSRAGLIFLTLLVLACGPAPAPPTGPSRPVDPAPTAALPLASLTPALTASATTVQRALGGAGFRVGHVAQAFRTGEPASLQFVPRALLQVLLADPDDGWILLYDLGSPDRATQAAGELVSYLQSGFGQTNFPTDAQFAVSQLDSTVLFTWWSRERSDEPERARAAFEALRLVGQPFPIVR